MEKMRQLTCIDFASEAEDRLADACAYDGAVLLLVVDDLGFSALDKVSRGLCPWSGKR